MYFRSADKYSAYSLLAISYRNAAAKMAMDYSAVQKLLRHAIGSSPNVGLHSIVELTAGSLHTLFLLTLTDGFRLVLKVAPSQNVRLLRHEQDGLASEVEVLRLLTEQRSVPVPRVLRYDPSGVELGSPYLLMDYIPGMPLKELHPCLNAHDKHFVDGQLGRYFSFINAAPQRLPFFGPVARVTQSAGFPTWRDAFLSLVEGVLRDAEDLVVVLPYEQIRYQVDRLSHVLDDIREPKLVVMNSGYSNILLDSRTKHVTALLDYSRALWGDPMLSEIFFSSSSAFFDGFGSSPSQTGRERTRLLLYACYRAIVAVVTTYYRPVRITTVELEARKLLLEALSYLAMESG